MEKKKPPRPNNRKREVYKLFFQDDETKSVQSVDSLEEDYERLSPSQRVSRILGRPETNSTHDLDAVEAINDSTPINTLTSTTALNNNNPFLLSKDTTRMNNNHNDHGDDCLNGEFHDEYVQVIPAEKFNVPARKALGKYVQERFGSKREMELNVLYSKANEQLEDDFIDDFPDFNEFSLSGKIIDDPGNTIKDSRFSRDDDYESELTDLDNWRHYNTEHDRDVDPIVLPSVRKSGSAVVACLRENSRTTLLLLLLSIIALFLLVALIVVLTKK